MSTTGQGPARRAPDAPAPDPGDALAARLRGFGPEGLVAILVILAGNFVVQPLSAVLVLVWARMARTPWREIGYVRPPSWTREVLAGVALGVALKLLMKAVVMPLLGADAINERFQHLVGNPAAVAAVLFPVAVSAGWGEETLFRGYLFERFGRLMGRRVPATIATVVLTSALFGIAHEGTAVQQQATLTGLVFGTVYAVLRRLWVVVFAHAAFNLAAVAIIHWNLEARIARLFFP